MKTKLSIVIVNHNTRDLLHGCLTSLDKVKDEVDFEIIVSDNNSSDSSVSMIKKDFPKVRVVENSTNLGFAKGNNQARDYVEGEYILFLNSDTIVKKDTLKKTVNYMDEHKEVGALTCKILLPDGKIDKDTRRAFITPAIGLVHLFLKLDRLFPHSKTFAKYWYGYMSEDTQHEVDVIQGAYFLSRKKIIDKLDWFDEDYFLDGEDIDLCWRIKKAGFKIIYFPRVSIIHFKGASKGKVESEFKKKVPLGKRLQFRMSGVNSMEIFYRKRLWKSYPIILNYLVILGIKLMKGLRYIGTLIKG